MCCHVSAKFKYFNKCNSFLKLSDSQFLFIKCHYHVRSYIQSTGSLNNYLDYAMHISGHWVKIFNDLEMINLLSNNGMQGSVVANL